MDKTINKIKDLLDDIRPFLNMEGGDLEFLKYEDNYVYIKLKKLLFHNFSLKIPQFGEFFPLS